PAADGGFAFPDCGPAAVGARAAPIALLAGPEPDEPPPVVPPAGVLPAVVPFAPDPAGGMNSRWFARPDPRGPDGVPRVSACRARREPDSPTSLVYRMM